MPSPFPGMDPYLESHWRDVHHRLITYASDALQGALPPELRARVEERVVLATPEGWGSSMFPDVPVIEHRPQRRVGNVAVLQREATEPLLIDVARERLTEGFIEIIDVSSGNRVVTILEVLSPANKMPGDNLEEYLHKQREILQSDTNLVEIDLPRGGRHVAAVPLDNIPVPRRTHYMVCIRRPTLPTKAGVYLMPLAEPLPIIKVPLRPGDADVPLDLQALITECYRNGRYEGDVDYRRDPEPPLTGPAATWVDELLRSKGLRPAPSPKRKRKRRPPGASDGA